MESLSIFFPFYNDAGTVEKMISEAYKYGNEICKDIEVIAVNDGSTDYTLEVLEQQKQIYPSLKIVNHEHNQGYGAALIDGINACTKKWIFYTDGDAQYHLDEIKKVLDLRKNGYAINGYKIHRSDNIIRTLVGHVYRISTKLIFDLPISDIDCDYRLMERNVLQSLNLECKSGAITVEMIKKLNNKNVKFIEVGVHHYPRVYGKSTFFKFNRILETISDEIKLIITLQSKK